MVFDHDQSDVIRRSSGLISTLVQFVPETLVTMNTRSYEVTDTFQIWTFGYPLCRKILGAEPVHPEDLSRMEEPLKTLGYGAGGVCFSYSETDYLGVPRHSNDTRSVELIIKGAFEYTFANGKVRAAPW